MMDLVQRAHIFSSFDALKGFREMLAQQEKRTVEKRTVSEDEIDELNRRIHSIHKGMMVSVEYFDGKDYISKKGMVSKINIELKKLQIVKTRITLDNIVWLEICEE